MVADLAQTLLFRWAKSADRGQGLAWTCSIASICYNCFVNPGERPLCALPQHAQDLQRQPARTTVGEPRLASHHVVASHGWLPTSWCAPTVLRRRVR